MPTNEIKKAVDNYLNRPFLFSWKPRNILLADVDEISQHINAKHILIDSISVDKKYFHDIEITVRERKVFAIYCRSETNSIEQATNAKIEDASNDTMILNDHREQYETKQCFYIDEKGIVFGEAPESQGSLIVTIKEVSDKNLDIGDKILDKNVLKLLLKIKSLLKNEEVQVSEFLLKDSLQNLEITVSEGWKIYLDTTLNIENQIEALSKALKEKISASEREALEYVDLRVLDRIYYK